MSRILLILALLLSLSASAQLPVIRISAEELSAEFHEGTFQLDEGEMLPIQIRYRGASSLRYSKKSFAIKFVDSEGEKQNVKLLGMRSDNSWILDAMAIDMARMRNRVSTDLWNDFSSRSYVAKENAKSMNGTRGQFVEVFLNEEYWGLYCLTEKIDRKQLQIMKSDEGGVHGAIMKSTAWTTMFSSGNDYYFFDNAKPVWQNWEMQFPDLDDDEAIDWQAFVEDIRSLNTFKGEKVVEFLNEHVDLPVWLDYFLMMEFINAEDNICKNQCVYYYDVADEARKMGIAPWDMDHSWGRDFKGDKRPSLNPCRTDYQRISYLYNRYIDPLGSQRHQRYLEMRLGEFDQEKLLDRFDKYFDLFESSGAAERERERWNGVDGFELDFDAEREYIHSWISDRIKYLDEFYNIIPDLSVTEVVTDDVSIVTYNLQGQRVNSDARGLIIRNGKAFIAR